MRGQSLEEYELRGPGGELLYSVRVTVMERCPHAVHRVFDAMGELLGGFIQPVTLSMCDDLKWCIGRAAAIDAKL